MWFTLLALLVLLYYCTPASPLRARASTPMLTATKLVKLVTNCLSVQWRVPERSGEVEGRPATAATTYYLLLQQARSSCNIRLPSAARMLIGSGQARIRCNNRLSSVAGPQELQHQTVFCCPHVFFTEHQTLKPRPT